jgi:hypothetical protein
MAIVAEKEAFTPVKSREDYEIAIRDRTPLPLLADLANYDPNTFDYCTTNKELPSRHQWIEIFRQSVAGFKKVAERDEAVAAHIRMQKAKEFEDRYEHDLGDFQAKHADCHTLQEEAVMLPKV